MDLQTVKVVINEQGQVTIKVEGAPGQTCLPLTKELEKALGIVLTREMTAESYEESQNAEHLNVQG